MIGIVESRADDASVNIADQLRDLVDFTATTDESVPAADGGGTYYASDSMELRTFDDLHIYLEEVTAPFSDLSLLVFPSRHAGDTGPLLTAHHTGNFGPAAYGGTPEELARACPHAHRRVLETLTTEAPPTYDVGMECTHHGPTDLETPAMFVEIGSGPDQWTDTAAARAVAKAIRSLRGIAPDTERTIIGFGGGHYVPRFDRIRTDTDWAIGHIAADWALDHHDDEIPRAVIDQAFEKSASTRAIIDGDYPDLAATISELGYRVVSETYVRETASIPLDLAAELEATLSPVAAGLRFGDAAPTTDYDIIKPAPALLNALNGIDLERTRTIVTEHAVAYETTENGNRVDGHIALPAGTTDDLVEQFLALLEDHYDSVTRKHDTIIVRSNEFDPATARELGIPDGPAFGALANGDTVELDDGTTIQPTDVHTKQTTRYEIDQA